MRKQLLFKFALFVIVSLNISSPAQIHLDNLYPNGTLHRSIYIGGLPFAQIVLQHRSDLEGCAPHDVVSDWRVPALFTYAGPEGRRHVVWVRPGGTVERFRNQDIQKSDPDLMIEPWTAVFDGGAGDYRFLGRDGSIYIYRQGQISELHLPGGRKYRFDTDGPRITRIRRQGSNTPLLQAEYNPTGHLTDLLIGEVRHRFDYSRDLGLLDSWRFSISEKPATFDYTDGLLTRITFPDGTQENFQWRKDLRSYEAETGLELPDPRPKVLLAEDDQYCYHWGINQQGINLVCIDEAGKRVGMIINPRTNELIQVNRDGGELMYFYALQRENGAGKLKEVRAPDGLKMLEHRFDKNHNLITRKQAGAPAEVFEYDSLGRLLKRQYPLGVHETWLYDNHGRVTEHRSLDGKLNRYAYMLRESIFFFKHHSDLNHSDQKYLILSLQMLQIVHSVQIIDHFVFKDYLLKSAKCK